MEGAFDLRTAPVLPILAQVVVGKPRWQRNAVMSIDPDVGLSRRGSEPSAVRNTEPDSCWFGPKLPLVGRISVRFATWLREAFTVYAAPEGSRVVAALFIRAYRRS
ncbi:hypothetical protein GCM10022224_004830 [Nonomuraea antimicrobica]|uniref:Uncharacterized protein n=1 Tax=Nonomuraea antimicrobica TaxID=561173 RepID=A0ABP7B0L0_9ACTN